MSKTVVFKRIRGRIIPIISDAVKGTSGYFGRKGKIKHHQDRIEAIKSVRNAISGKLKTIDSGLEARFVYKDKSKVIKEMGRSRNPNAKINRLAVESTLYEKGFGPKTFLVRTSSKDYFVQDYVGKDVKSSLQFKKRKMGSITWTDLSKRSIKSKSHAEKAKQIANNLKKLIKSKTGIELEDLHSKNFAFKNKKPMVLDGGHASFPDDQGYFSKSLVEKISKVRAKKYIIKGRTKE